MKAQEERQFGKLRYEKPTAADLGPTAPVVGASCPEGAQFGQGGCIDVGNDDAGTCALLGNSAGQGCGTGALADGGCDQGGGRTDQP